MVTGETDVSRYRTFLLLGWDGRSLQWASGQAGSIDKVGEEVALDAAAFEEACSQLKNKGLVMNRSCSTTGMPFSRCLLLRCPKGTKNSLCRCI